jgi:hypothetical protein
MFSLWKELFVHYALRFEKSDQHDLDAEPLEFQFLRPRANLTNPFRNPSLCFGVTYRVIQEESAILWEMTVCVILRKKVYMNMGPILNGYGVMTA